MGGVIGSDGTTFGKGGLFNPETPKAIKPPEPPAPPDPAAISLTQGDASDFEIRGERARSGISKTFLTGNLSPSSTGKKKTTLG
jgi:hypothetical protein